MLHKAAEAQRLSLVEMKPQASAFDLLVLLFLSAITWKVVLVDAFTILRPQRSTIRLKTPSRLLFDTTESSSASSSSRRPWGDADSYTSDSDPYPPSIDSNFHSESEEDSISPSPSLKANRFSKFAPDPNLPADEFRAQLKENMKANLEERRRNNPNRGNQPAKSYLDSL